MGVAQNAGCEAMIKCLVCGQAFDTKEEAEEDMDNCTPCPELIPKLTYVSHWVETEEEISQHAAEYFGLERKQEVPK